MIIKVCTLDAGIGSVPILIAPDKVILLNAVLPKLIVCPRTAVPAASAVIKI